MVRAPPRPLSTKSPRRLILGNLHSYTRIPIRYRGVGKRACSASFLEEGFPETKLPVLEIIGYQTWEAQLRFTRYAVAVSVTLATWYHGNAAQSQKPYRFLSTVEVGTECPKSFSQPAPPLLLGRVGSLFLARAG